ncbi:MAG: 50S ribosomal protein L24 [Chitinivibrionales bacterium]|nr:50S ribosomal protein L24 [Chitinivibrionales bacterium]
MPARLKKNDTVMITAGEFKGETGRIIRILPDKNKALVEGKNIVKRHTKPNPNNQQGGIVEKEAPIHLANLMLMCSKTGKPTRVGSKILDSGKRVRFSKKAKETVD